MLTDAATDLAPAALRLPQNQLLAALPEPERGQLLAQCETLRVQAGQLLFEPGQRPGFMFFPLDTLVSLLAVADGRMTLEVSVVGREGMLGASVLHAGRPVQLRAVVQRSGRVLRIEAACFARLFEQMPVLQHLLQRYTDALLAQVIQIAVCSRFHMLEARLARSLLMTRDRLQSEKFHLTHEFLAQMLGVRRVGVTKAASALQEKKLIGYSRGNIEILDGAGLEQAACHCYGLVREDGVLGLGQVLR
ncbi:Crp/Fnr family transcriptional regulator [Pseudoduganella danionis]|uniref:Helix-turn-helix domain-containing protein n=1 Tax=Pseudoduganella danionis TaxID=1890295 RepID=A0ABW9SJQ3_9BURK|nr:Crp/Fnr family transcriptional regulator [Pseudoduganella danionis]MTW32215.1 helix-turn-helix domain-containing protein [Pseudoduganella danionis]